MVYILHYTKIMQGIHHYPGLIGPEILLIGVSYVETQFILHTS